MTNKNTLTLAGISIIGFIFFSNISSAQVNSSGLIPDADGNLYDTVRVGNQIWFTKNLKTTHFNDDTAIPIVTSQIEWANLNTPAYCWYSNDQNLKDKYGALYNGYVVASGKLCPAGWQIPTDADWNTLVDFLGGPTVAGGKLKAIGTTDWQNPNKGATNERGFEGLPGGIRLEDNFYSIGLAGYWWSSSEYEPNYAWSQSVQYDEEGMMAPAGLNYKIGLSVRCVKNLTSSVHTITTCDSYQWIDGETYTESNNSASVTLTSKAGIDSIVTLNLTIRKSTTAIHTISACESYTWIDGNTYTESNSIATFTLTNKVGCDSVVTLNLTIRKSTTATHNISACESYAWIDGNTYTESNSIATFTLTNKVGCDSVVTLNLTIRKSTTATHNISACESYAWIDGNTYTESNSIATFTLTNKVGCDSVVALNLTIVVLDASVSTASLPTLTANIGNAAYEWLDCESENVIENETDRSFTPTMSGHYRVNITKDGCTINSECFSVVITSIPSMETRTKIYPNPTNGDFTILFDERFIGGHIYISDQLGHTVLSKDIDQTGMANISLETQPGLYLVRLKSKSATTTYLKLVKM